MTAGWATHHAPPPSGDFAGGRRSGVLDIAISEELVNRLMCTFWIASHVLVLAKSYAAEGLGVSTWGESCLGLRREQFPALNDIWQVAI